jgi:hypothetical protein
MKNADDPYRYSSLQKEPAIASFSKQITKNTDCWFLYQYLFEKLLQIMKYF